MEISYQIVVKYLTMLGIEYEKKKDSLFNLRCPICKDSKTNIRLKRGYIIGYNNLSNWRFYCHNCSANISFYDFIKTQFPQYFDDFKHDVVARKTFYNFKPVEVIPDNPFMYKTIELEIMEHMYDVATLQESHPCRVYLAGRKIPLQYEMYYTNKLDKIISLITKEECHYKGEYVILPFRDANKKLMYIQGRNLDKRSKFRFLTKQLVDKNEKDIKVWGMDYLKKDNPRLFITEAGFDAMMIKENGIGMAGSASNIEKLTGLLQESGFHFDKKNIVFIFDNEYNEVIYKKMVDVVQRGYSIYKWNNYLPYKDFNEWYQNGGISLDFLYNDILKNITNSYQAQLYLKTWTNRA